MATQKRRCGILKVVLGNFVAGVNSGAGVVSGASVRVAEGNSGKPCGFSSAPTNPAEVAKSSLVSPLADDLKGDQSGIVLGATTAREAVAVLLAAGKP